MILLRLQVTVWEALNSADADFEEEKANGNMRSNGNENSVYKLNGARYNSVGGQSPSQQQVSNALDRASLGAAGANDDRESFR